MKTIVHIELSDSDRNDLAKRIYRDSDTKVLVTRKEVTETVLNLIQREIEDGRHSVPELTDGSGVHGEDGQERPTGDDNNSQEFIPSRGDEEYLAHPSDPGLAAACSRILDDTALIQNFAWDTIERNRK